MIAYFLRITTLHENMVKLETFRFGSSKHYSVILGKGEKFKFIRLSPNYCCKY